MERILEHLPDGVVVLDAESNIQWANQQFLRLAGRDDVIDRGFYASLNNPEVLGPDFCPFNTALSTGEPSSSTVRTADNRYFNFHVAPLREDETSPQQLIVTVREVTEQVIQQQKISAIHQAGIELANLRCSEDLSVDERVELLKQNILHFTQDLLKYDVIEIRLLDERTSELKPLLSFGIDKEAAVRPLFAQSRKNGVTGFVASSGKSYLCEDTTRDPLYLIGVQGAKSSMTVPLMMHDQVIGTFNVESPKPSGFTEYDLQFLEIFARDVAVALNTLQLLAVEKHRAARQNVEAIHAAVALPVDDILNNAVSLIEENLEREPAMLDRLGHILSNARDIRQVIQQVGRRLAPAQAVAADGEQTRRPKLEGRRILVVDNEERVRTDAHRLLERHGCIVETAQDGKTANCMVRNCGVERPYDIIISAVRLPDMSGHQLMLRLKEKLKRVPLILMQGFGWDSGHTIPEARKAGLHPRGVLFKPFKPDQVLNVIEIILDAMTQPELPPPSVD